MSSVEVERVICFICHNIQDNPTPVPETADGVTPCVFCGWIWARRATPHEHHLRDDRGRFRCFEHLLVGVGFRWLRCGLHG